MSLWDSVSTTYVEAATSAFPLHRAVVFAGGLMGSIAVHHQTHLSIFETLARLPLADITSLTKGPLGKASVADVMAGVAIIIAGWIFSRLTLRLVFALASRSTDLRARVAESEAQAPIDKEQSLADRQKAMELIDASLKEPRVRLRNLGAAAELTSGLAIAGFVAFHWGNVVDFLFAFAMLVTSVVIQTNSVRIFLADYFGPALFKARLQGKKAPAPTGLS
jgi:hypothetical protein